MAALHGFREHLGERCRAAIYRGRRFQSSILKRTVIQSAPQTENRRSKAPPGGSWPSAHTGSERGHFQTSASSVNPLSGTSLRTGTTSPVGRGLDGGLRAAGVRLRTGRGIGLEASLAKGSLVQRGLRRRRWRIVTGTIFTAKDYVKEAAGYNPSVTSLRTGDTSPCTGEAFSSADGTGDRRGGRHIWRPYMVLGNASVNAVGPRYIAAADCGSFQQTQNETDSRMKRKPPFQGSPWEE